MITAGDPGTPSQTPSGPGAGSSAQPAPAGGGLLPPRIDGVTTAIEAINAARLRAQGPPLLVAQLSAAWGGGWFYFAGVLDARTRACRGFAVHRVLHRGLIEEALREALPEGPRPTPVVFCPRCRDAGTGFPAWALASAAEVAACDSFAGGLREMLTPEAERGCRSQPDVARAARRWIERSYNPSREALRLESAA